MQHRISADPSRRVSSHDCAASTAAIVDDDDARADDVARPPSNFTPVIPTGSRATGSNGPAAGATQGCAFFNPTSLGLSGGMPLRVLRVHGMRKRADARGRGVAKPRGSSGVVTRTVYC